MALTLGLAGCVQHAPPAQTGPDLSTSGIKAASEMLRSEGKREQSNALENGAVSRDEYSSLVASARGCIERKGWHTTEPQLSPVDGKLLLFMVTHADDKVERERSKADSAYCKDKFLTVAEAVYQATAPTRMDPKLRDKAAECLQYEGYEVSKKARTPEAMAGPNRLKADGSPSARSSKTMDCIVDAQGILYPELPYAIVSY
ncbi:hypothetical protein BIU95_07070 [Curtobacterium sp. MCBA15_007]|uniref:hypothetical protein n=1 Tax=Curtobacterium sp. MCBA15_007 TaxID=1898735 RepID=UPI0008DC6824|nr:hypothetical protein [Curtobacterium sp. MCBA15_007]OII01439.1 hypothetical protein BIU95_07070 [Curtobacterium sp. MCBA15_007]